MTYEKNIPNATAKRLSLYYRIFKRFHRENIDKTSSKQIAEAIGIDPATVRRDFSYFGELGRRGFGYDVSKLMTFFAELLNDNATTKVVLVGVGNIGRALLHYRFQERNRMQLVMAFDRDDNELVGSQTEDNIPIYGISSNQGQDCPGRYQNGHPDSAISQGTRRWLSFWLMLESKASSAFPQSTSTFHATWFSNT